MDKLSLEVEFPIDNERLKQESDQAKAQIMGVGETAQKVQERVEKQINEVVSKSNNTYVEREGILESLKRRMSELKTEAEKSTSFVAIEKANTEIQLFEREINRLTRIGRQGFDDMGNAIPDFDKPIGKINRLTYAANLYRKAIKEATNTSIIEKYNFKLQQTETQITRLNNVGKAGFDQLGNSLEKNTKQSIGFVSGLSKGVEMLRRMAYIIPGLGLTGLLALGIEPIMKWIKALNSASGSTQAFNKTNQETASVLAKELGETQLLINKINDHNVSETERQSLLNKLISKSPAVLGALDLQNIATAKGTKLIDEYIVSLREKLELQQLEQGYIESMQREADLRSGKLSEETDKSSFSNAVFTAGQILLFGSKEKTERIIKETNEARRKEKADAQALITKDYEDRIKATIEGQANLNQVEDTSLKSLEAKLTETKERLRTLQKGESAKSLLAEKKDIEKQIKEREKLLGLETKQSPIDTSVARAATMYQKVYDIKAKYSRKSLTDDEEALQAIRDEFIKITKEVEIFNLNPKNKIKVSAKELDEVRDQAITDLKYKQETEQLKITLTEQKKLYQDYEDYKISLGKDKADEKYKSLIDTEKSHLENLRAELAKIPASDPTGSQSSRKEELEKQIREEESLQLKKFNDLLKANQSYQDKVKIAIEQFEADKKKLIEDGRVSEVAVLTTNHEENLLSLTENHIKQLDAYKKLFDGIELLSNAQAKKVIKEARDMLANTDMPEALYVKTLALIQEAEKALRDRIYDRVSEIGVAFDDMASGVDGLNEGLTNSLRILGDMLHAVSTVGKSVGDIKAGIANYGDTKKDAGGGVLGTIAGVAGIAGPVGKAVGAVANLAKGIVGIFKAAKESRIQAEKELAEFDNQRLNAEFQVNALYRERLRTQMDINRTTLDGIKQNQQELSKQKLENEKDAERLMNILQGEEFVAGKKTEKYGGFLGIGRKTRVVDVMAGLGGKSYEEIEKLFMSRQLVGRAKEVFEELRKLKSEGIDIIKLEKEEQKALWDKATGTTSESITDSIIKGFENGYRSAADFADDFKGLMNQATREIFKDFVQNKEMEAFYERYANMAKDGSLTDAQRVELKGVYDAMIGRINNKYEDLKGITGEDFLNDPAGKEKGIRGIQRELTTEKTASEFTGLTRANFDLNKRQFAVTEKMLEIDRKHFDATLAMMRNSVLIEENTKNTVTELKNAVIELKDINKNTKSNSSGYDRGF